MNNWPQTVADLTLQPRTLRGDVPGSETSLKLHWPQKHSIAKQRNLLRLVFRLPLDVMIASAFMSKQRLKQALVARS